DLDGIMFPDAAWVVAPDSRSRTAKEALRRHWPRSAMGLSRLFALGHDAALLVPSLGRLSPPSATVDGVTGRLSVNDRGIVMREFAWAEMRGGRPVPLSPGALPPAPA